MNHPIVVHDPPRQCQQQCPGLLGHAVLIGAGSDCHRHLVRRGGLNVDQVVPHAGAGDYSQLGGERKQISRHALATGDQGINCPQKRVKLLAQSEKSPSGSTTSNPASVRIWQSGLAEIATDKDRSKLLAWSSR